MNRVSFPHRSTTGVAVFCGHCGEPRTKETSDDGSAPPSNVHQTCEARLQLEPPRYCAHCGRRLKVQVSPFGWLASCSRHGIASS
jgi:hypothetical protein